MNKLMRVKNFVFGCFYLLIFFLNGCASLQKAPTSTSLSDTIQTSNHWMLDGQIGVQTAERSGSASLKWTQDDDQYHIHLFGPLGLGSTQLIGNRQSIELINHQGQTFSAHFPEALMQQQLGWSIPVSPLIYWIRGMPAPHIPSQKHYKEDHKISELNQAGWTIQYLSYKNNLPQFIQMQNKNAKLKIFVHRWEKL